MALLRLGTGGNEAVRIARQLIVALQEPVPLAGFKVTVQASVGIVLFPGHGRDADSLIRRASAAASQARGTVPRYALYAGSLDQECVRHLALVGDLHQAIIHDELILYCQPKVDMASARICGAEALVR